MAFPRGGSSSTVSRSNWNLEVLVFVEGGKPEYPEKNPRSRVENQQQTQPTYDARSRNRTSSSTVSRSNWNLEVSVFVEGGKPEYPEKNPRSRVENQQQTQPTYDAGSRNRTRATLVGGERSHHCAIPAPPIKRKAQFLFSCLISAADLSIMRVNSGCAHRIMLLLNTSWQSNLFRFKCIF